MDGMWGLDLLAYRYDGDVERLVRAVVESVEVPVIAAGSVDSEEKIRALADAGVWGFTVGSAIFEGRFAHNSASTREQVETVLAASRAVAP
jgi:phosphoribosylformimino-5-aminoimidazole carboxamide ribonucleotide (ProFAR) isomerase